MKQNKSKKEEKKDSEQIEKLEALLQDIQKEKDDLFEKFQRISADYANFQKRVPKQITDSLTYEKENLIKSFLPVLDNFEHTLQNAQSAHDFDVLIKGVRIIYDQMLDILKSHQVEQIQAKGEVFDPAMHQAMLQQNNPDLEPDVVIEEFQKGYKLNGRIIRPSKVIVNKLPQESPPAEQPEKNETDKADEENGNTE
jgi:molecular chaperone GrpE